MATIVHKMFKSPGTDENRRIRRVEKDAPPATVAAPLPTDLLKSAHTQPGVTAARVLANHLSCRTDREYIRLFGPNSETGQNQTASFGETQ
jgi:hypothetical protein